MLNILAERQFPVDEIAALASQRCLYENDEIMVEHSVMTFPDGTSEAVLVVNHIKAGKVIRVETGATPIK